MAGSFFTEHMKWFESLVAEFGTALAADLASRFLFGGKAKKEVLVQAGDLMVAGKQEEGKQVLHSHFAGIGRADEEVLVSDLLFIRRTNRVSKQLSDRLARYLAGLTPAARKRFRDAHNEQHDVDLRRLKLIELARCATPALKRAYLDAAGIFDPDMADELEELADRGNRWLDGVQRRQNQHRARSLRRLAHRHPVVAIIIAAIAIVALVLAFMYIDKQTLVIAVLVIIGIYGFFAHGARTPEVGL